MILHATMELPLCSNQEYLFFMADFVNWIQYTVYRHYKDNSKLIQYMSPLTPQLDTNSTDNLLTMSSSLFSL